MLRPEKAIFFLNHRKHGEKNEESQSLSYVDCVYLTNTNPRRSKDRVNKRSVFICILKRKGRQFIRLFV